MKQISAEQIQELSNLLDEAADISRLIREKTMQNNGKIDAGLYRQLENVAAEVNNIAN